MQWRNSRDGYGLTSRTLHWLLVGLVWGVTALGLWMVGLDYYHPWYYRSVEWHKLLGLLIVGLSLMVSIWAVINPWPPLPAFLPVAQRLAARLMHGALLVLMVAIPVSGYLISTASGKPLTVFGAHLPAFLVVDVQWRPMVEQAHRIGAYGLAGLGLMHAAAALWHQWRQRDGILGRML